jgi:hypothetical protein
MKFLQTCSNLKIAVTDFALRVLTNIDQFEIIQGIPKIYYTPHFGFLQSIIGYEALLVAISRPYFTILKFN